MDDYDDDFEGEPSHPSNTISHPEYSQQFDTLSQEGRPPHRPPPVHQRNDQRRALIEENSQKRKIAYELATQIDQLKEKRRKQQQGRAQHTEQSEGEEAPQSLRAIIGKQQLEMTTLRTQIYALQKKVEQSYDAKVSKEKSEERGRLEGELRALQEEREFLGRIKKDQKKALKAIRNDKEHEERVRQLREECVGLKEECRALTEQLNHCERQQRKHHETLRKKQARIREYEGALREEKEWGRRENTGTVSPAMLEEVEGQIERAERERRENEKAYLEKEQIIEAELGEKRREEERRLIIFKDKEREGKLNEIRLKELRKLVQHHSQLLQRPPQEEEADLKEFRHRRNIRHMNQ